LDARAVRQSDAAGRVPEGGPMAEDDLDVRARRDIEALIELLKPEGRQSFRAMTEAELIRLHFSYGMWLRNQFRQNKFPALFRFCSEKTTPDTRSFDEISSLAIHEIWRHLRSSPIR
jgi:hypothetical protein